MSAKKTVKFPDLLDEYGASLTNIINELKRDTLKPALISDVSKTIYFTWSLQQLIALLYNLNVQNYEVLMNRIVAEEQKTQKLEERIIDLEKEVKVSIKTIIKDIEENGEMRQVFKKLLT